MRQHLLLSTALAFALGGCSSIQTTQDFSPTANFAGLRTFDWMPDPPIQRDARVDNDLIDQRFKTALEEVLEAKGFDKISSGRADFRVGYHLALDEEIDYQTLNTYYGGGWGYRGMYGPRPVGVSTVQERRYTVGTLIIDVFDVESQELVWRGSGEGRVSDDERTPEERQERVTQAVRLVLERFPPNG